MSQATCKVCQNKILIRRPPEGTPLDTLVSAPGVPQRQPAATPTKIAGEDHEPTVADPALPPLGGAPPVSSSAAVLQNDPASAFASLPEQELSASWREAIVDNRETIQMLKKLGLPGPKEASTAEGPAVRMPIGTVPEATAVTAPTAPPVPATPQATAITGSSNIDIRSAPTNPGTQPAPAPAPAEEKLELASPRPRLTPPPAPSPMQRAATLKAPARHGASRLLSLAAGAAGAAIAAADLYNGSWAAGLSGWLGFGAACFVAVAGTLNALLRGPGAFAIVGITFVGSLVAIAAMLGAFLTGGPRTRILAEAHPFLAPLAAYEMTLREGPPPPATPEPTPSPSVEETPSTPEAAPPDETPEP